MRIYSEARGIEFGIKKMSHANNEKRETTNDGSNETTKSRKDQNAQRKVNLQVLRNIGSGHHQTSGDERKKLKRISQKNEKTTWNKT